VRQMTLEDAQRERDRGIAAAEAGTERVCLGWRDVALAFIVKFAVRRPPEDHFTGEDVVDAYNMGNLMPPPKGDKAWGGVIQTAQRRGFIGKVPGKTAPRRKGHCAMAPVFYSRIYGLKPTEVFE
jgi:hypothetical protein